MAITIDLSKPLLDQDGKVVQHEVFDKKDIEFANKNGTFKLVGTEVLTMKKAVLGCLNHRDQNTTPEQFTKQAELIGKIGRATLVSFESEDVVLIKDMSKKAHSPIISIQLMAVLEGKPNPFENEPTGATN